MKYAFVIWGVLFLLFHSMQGYAEVEVGKPAPAFTASDQDGKPVHLFDFKGQYLLIYFYPKDDTPGCTKEACAFRDHYADFKKNGIAILGVSVQDAKSHQEFRKKYHIPFPLIVDNDAKLAALYGVPKYPIVGLLKRQSVLIGRDGKVIQFYADVDPKTHYKQVLDALKTTRSNVK